MGYGALIDLALDLTPLVGTITAGASDRTARQRGNFCFDSICFPTLGITLTVLGNLALG